MKQHLSLIVWGKVQGVGLRYEIKEKADSADIHGYVRNMRDGTVNIVLEGNYSTLRNFVDMIKKGSGIAKIQKIDIKEGDVEGYREFTVF